MILERGLVLELSKIYGSLTSELLTLLQKPPRRLYIRVNNVYTNKEEVINALLREGIPAFPDEYVEDAIYVEVEGPRKIECATDKVIIVDNKTAASLMLGANLYRPGIIRSDRFDRGDYLLAVSQSGFIVACVKAVSSYHNIICKQKGLVGVNISSVYKAPSIAETNVYARGMIYLQSLPSIVTSHVLGPKPGELIVDMNASPGGKTSHIVQITGGRARVLAIDRSEKKVQELRTTLERLGLNINVITLPWDSRYLHLDFNLRDKVDKVLIDPPCSNLGVRPVTDLGKTIKDVVNLSSYQKQFLKAAWWVLKRGGVLVYSTCTLTKRENEDNIVYAVEELGFNVIEAKEALPYLEKVKYKGIIAYRFSPFTMDMPGYFIAVMSK